MTTDDSTTETAPNPDTTDDTTDEAAEVDTGTPAPAANADDTPDSADESPDTPADDGGGNDREAAKYRRRLRDTEGERDRLASVVESYQRRDAETEALTAGLASGADLWAGGVQLADILNDQGNLDHGKVHQHVTRIIAERPHWRAYEPPFSHGPRTPAPTGGTWADLIRGGGG